MERITRINEIIFNYLIMKLKKLGLDADRKGFDEIRYNLYNSVVFSPDDFAFECFYVVCVAGFKQDYAKAISNRIIDFVKGKDNFEEEDLLKIYKNKMKVRAIKNIWDNRKKYQEQFYALETTDEKVEFLGKLPHIGNITKYHLARNLGLDFVKYDIWIQRLGVALYGSKDFVDRVNNSKLLDEIKCFCDEMFNDIKQETGEKVGFIDVVLWRACQKGLLKIDGMNVYYSKSDALVL